MTTLSSSFLPTFPHLKVSSTTKIKTPHTYNTRPKISFTNFTHNNQPPQPSNNNNKPLLEPIFQALDHFISTSLDQRPLRPSIDPTRVLAGNFAPVDELPPTACRVTAGSLPGCLDGAYIRNGPNPQFIPHGPHHLFDGDGMLHAVKVSKGEATFCSRYVKTYKYNVERRVGYPVFLSIFSSFNGLKAAVARSTLFFTRVLKGQFNPKAYGFGLANTSLAVLCGKLYALGESDIPYAIKITPDGDIVTLGRHNFHSEQFQSMTAHPKIDPDTGEVFAYGYNIFRPYLTYFRISPNGRKQNNVPIFSMERASFIHDFAVTKNYAIFPDMQIVIDAAEIVRGRAPVGIDPHKTPRLGIIPRYASDELEMRWINVPGLNMLHVANAWEEDDGDTIVIVGSNILSVENALDRMNLIHLSMERIMIDANAKEVITRYPISSKSLDFGVVNPGYAGKKSRYIYAAVTDPMPKVAGVVKIDLSLSEPDHVVASRLYGPGCYGGEPIFVPREAENGDADDEDDGYIITYLHDERSEKSRFIVMDAKSPDLDIVADVMLPGRVPYGFHGIFVKENALNMM